MRRTPRGLSVLCLSLLLPLAGCGPGSHPIVGAWELDIERTRDRALDVLAGQLEDLPEEVRAAPAAALRTAVARWSGSLEFRDDGTVDYRLTLPQPAGPTVVCEEVGTWVADERGLRMQTGENGGGVTAELTMPDDDRLELREERSGIRSTFLFRRVVD